MLSLSRGAENAAPEIDRRDFPGFIRLMTSEGAQVSRDVGAKPHRAGGLIEGLAYRFKILGF